MMLEEREKFWYIWKHKKFFFLKNLEQGLNEKFELL